MAFFVSEASDCYVTPHEATVLMDMAAAEVAATLDIHVYRTSGFRGARGPGDKSYHRLDLGRDYDFKLESSHYSLAAVGDMLRKRLPARWFDIVVEEDHVHIEYDPKF